MVIDYQLSAQRGNFRNFELCLVLVWGVAMHEMCKVIIEEDTMVKFSNVIINVVNHNHIKW